MNISTMITLEAETGHRKTLDEFCDTLQKQIAVISTRLNAIYFSHSTYQQQGSKDGFQFEV